MQITWTSCAERMPPDGMRVIIKAYGEYMKFEWESSILNRIATEKTNWTEFTKEKWEYLNK